MKIYAVEQYYYTDIIYQRLFTTKEKANKHYEELKQEIIDDYNYRLECDKERILKLFPTLEDYVDYKMSRYVIEELEVE